MKIKETKEYIELKNNEKLSVKERKADIQKNGNKIKEQNM